MKPAKISKDIDVSTIPLAPDEYVNVIGLTRAGTVQVQISVPADGGKVRVRTSKGETWVEFQHLEQPEGT